MPADFGSAGSYGDGVGVQDAHRRGAAALGGGRGARSVTTDWDHRQRPPNGGLRVSRRDSTNGASVGSSSTCCAHNANAVRKTPVHRQNHGSAIAGLRPRIGRNRIRPAASAILAPLSLNHEDSSWNLPGRNLRPLIGSPVRGDTGALARFGERVSLRAAAEHRRRRRPRGRRRRGPRSHDRAVRHRAMSTRAHRERPAGAPP